jgi:predicted CXXCH cytochrome family protein
MGGYGGEAINVKTSRIQFLIFIGSLFIVSGVMLLMMSSATVVQAQDSGTTTTKAPTYAGTKECTTCHRSLSQSHSSTNHALALQDVRKKKTPILGDFDQGEDVRTVKLPDEDTARPFTAKDIAFVVGSGVHVQRYLVESGKNQYMVLPVEWNVEKKQWEPYKLAEAWPDQAYDWVGNCAYCHTTGFDAAKAKWKDPGVQCESCHGPASEHVKIAKDIGKKPTDDELNQVRAAIYTVPDAQVCGQCHSQGVGKDNLPYPVGYTPGANLTDFFQLTPKDSADHWWVTGHASKPNMQYNEWFKSGHASALNDMAQNFAAADKCLSCHSQDGRRNAELIAAVGKGDREGQAPDPLKVTDAQLGITCQTCHYQHTDSKEPFELVQEANSLCMSCHTNPADSQGPHHPVKEMFQGTTLVSGIDGVEGVHFKATDGPVCLTCHMQQIPIETTSRANHTFKPVLPGADEKLPSACAGCHTDLTTTDMKLLVQNIQTVVKSRLAVANARLANVPEPAAGDDTRAQYDQVVAALNFVQNDGSLGVHNYAYADKLLSSAENSLALLNIAGATAQATEAPAPTATPLASTTTVKASNVSVPATGIRPVTVLLIGVVIVIILTAAFFFFRKSGTREELQ